ncbi:hypothetical protein D3C87_1656430 [compost metagenome]
MDSWVCVCVIAEPEPVITFGEGQYDFHPLEAFSDAVCYLLVGTQFSHTFSIISSHFSGIKPEQLSCGQRPIRQFFTCLHAWLILAPVRRIGRVVTHHLNYFRNWNGAATCTVTAEHPMG